MKKRILWSLLGSSTVVLLLSIGFGAFLVFKDIGGQSTVKFLGLEITTTGGGLGALTIGVVGAALCWWPALKLFSSKPEEIYVAVVTEELKSIMAQVKALESEIRIETDHVKYAGKYLDGLTALFRGLGHLAYAPWFRRASFDHGGVLVSARTILESQNNELEKLRNNFKEEAQKFNSTGHEHVAVASLIAQYGRTSQDLAQLHSSLEAALRELAQNDK